MSREWVKTTADVGRRPPVLSGQILGDRLVARFARALFRRLFHLILRGPRPARTCVLAVLALLVASLGAISPSAASEHTTAEPAVAAQAVTAGSNQGDPSAEATALEEAKRTGHRVEVTAEDTETETVYANPDGTMTSEVSEVPIRARNDAGDLVPVNLGLTTQDGRLAPAASTTDVSFSSTGDGQLASLDTAGASSFAMSYADSLDAPTVKDGVATYPVAGADPASVKLGASETGFTAHVVIPDRPTQAPTYTFPLHLNGLHAALKDGELLLSNDAGDVVASSSTLKMWDAQVDAAGDPSNVAPVDAALVDQPDGGTALQLRPSMAFLSDPATQYPVTVDPDITSNTGYAMDTYLYKANPDNNYASDYVVRVGNNGNTNGISRAIEWFNLDRFMGRAIQSATLNMYQYYAQTCTNAVTEVYAMDPKNGGPYTWNNASTDYIDDGRWYTTQTGNAGGGTSCPDAYQGFDVGKQIIGFTSGAINSGEPGSGSTEATRKHDAMLFLKAISESTTNSDRRFCSMNIQSGSPCDSASYLPKLSITYTPDLGEKSSYSMTKHALNDRASLDINNDNGNAVVNGDDLTIQSLGQSLNINRYYNAQSTRTGAFGPNWTLSGGPDVYLDVRGSYRVDYFDPSGVMYAGFLRKSATSTDPNYPKYHTPLGGVGATLVDNKDGSGQYTLTMHKSQAQYLFDDVDPNSGDRYLTKVTDRSGNETNYRYVPNTHQLASVDDASGHTVSFTYTSGVITSMTESNDSGTGTRTWSYGYTGGRLTSYTDPAGKTTDYHYDAATYPGIDTITDPANQSGARPTATLTNLSNQVVAVRYSTPTSTVGYDFTYSGGGDGNPAASRCVSSGTNDFDRSTDVWSDDGGTEQVDKRTTYCFKNRTGSSTGSTDAVQRVVDADGNRRSTSYSADSQPDSFTSGSNAGSTGTSGSTLATYGSGELSDQLQKTTDPKDTATGSATSTSLDYSDTPSGKQGASYLPSAKLDGNGVCVAYFYDKYEHGTVATGDDTSDSKGRLTDAYLDDTDDCSNTTDGRHYHQELNPDGTVAYSYDPDGSSAPGQRTDYTYWKSTDTGFVAGTKGMVHTVTKPGGSCSGTRNLCTTYTYDGLARIATMTDGRGEVTSYSYDKLDRVTQVLVDGATSCSVDPGKCFKYTYDAEGNLTQRDDPNGTTTLTYDRLNRQQSITTPDGTKVEYDYNSDGKTTMVKQTLPSSQGGLVDTVTYTYDDANTPSSAVFTAPDSTGTPTQHTIVLDSDADSRESYVKFPTSPEVTVDRGFTTAGRPKTITVEKTGVTNDQLPDTTFDYQKNGNDTNQLQKKTIDNSDTNINQTVTYDYWGVGQLKSAAVQDGATTTYNFDDAGNLTSEVPSSGSTTYYGYDRASQLCWQGPQTGTALVDACPTTPPSGANGTDTKVNQDAAGNSLGTSTTPLTYNAANQVSSIGSRDQHYNDLGNDLRVNTGTNTLVNSSVGIISRTPASGGDTTFYVRSPSGKILASHTQPTTGAATIRYYVTDQQGSVTTLLKEDGSRVAFYRYTPYGDPTILEDDTANTGATNPFRYLGGYYDTEGDGYTKLGARYYDNHSHFTQPDPKPGTINNPMGTLDYAYSGCDPINHSDPSGDTWCGYAPLFNLTYGAWKVGSGVGGLAYSETGIGLVYGGYQVATGSARVYRSFTQIDMLDREDCSGADLIKGVAPSFAGPAIDWLAGLP